LSGALGGLLGAVPPDQFLVGANNYLLRQNWHEGFATAVHLAVDLVTGQFSITSAGHPPAAWFDAGSGRWTTVEADGAMLGLLPCTEYVAERGAVRQGDALLLYTDGLIEVPGRDLSMGVDKLLGEAERLVTLGFESGARHLIDAAAPGAADDRALVVIHRP
jgi:serine phosphatase RsbU (regulator of sigma subunit)